MLIKIFDIGNFNFVHSLDCLFIRNMHIISQVFMLVFYDIGDNVFSFYDPGLTNITTFYETIKSRQKTIVNFSIIY